MAKAKYTKDKYGYFQTKVWDGTYVDGRKHRIPLRSKKSSADLGKKVIKFNQEVKERKHIRKTDSCFYEYAKTWQQVYKVNASNKTKEMYSNIINRHLKILEGVPLQEIDRIHLQTVLNNANGKKRTQQQIRMAFKQVVKSAVLDRLFSADVAEDMFNNVDKIDYKPSEKRPLAEHEKKAVFECELKEQDRVFLYLLYGCGIRRGEAVALTRNDIDLDKKELTINKSADLTYNTPEEKEPKSHNGYRVVPIPNKIYPTIEKFLEKRFGNEIEEPKHLFLTQAGKQMTESCYTKMWARILKAMQKVSDVEIKGLTAHVFRHNYCTNLCYQIPTVSIKKIAQLMGDTEKMVLNVYNHIILEKEDATTAVENALDF